MSARDVIALTKHQTIFFGSPTALVENQPSYIVGLVGSETADAILAALADANYAIVPVTLLAKIPTDPPMSGLPQTELTAATVPPPSSPEER